jgi:hypothetical protein
MDSVLKRNVGGGNLTCARVPSAEFHGAVELRDLGNAARNTRENSHVDDVHVVPQLDRSGYPRG